MPVVPENVQAEMESEIASPLRSPDPAHGTTRDYTHEGGGVHWVFVDMNRDVVSLRTAWPASGNTFESEYRIDCACTVFDFVIMSIDE